MRSRTGPKSLYLLGFGVTLLVLSWLAFTLDWGEVAQALSQIELWALVPMTLMGLSAPALRAMRWRFLLKEAGQDSFRNLFDSLMLGNFATFVLPLRAGEIVRPLALTRVTRHTFGEGLSSLVVERFIDLSVVLLSFRMMLFFVEGAPEFAQRGAGALAVAAGLLFGFIVAAGFAPRSILRASRRVLGLLPPRLAALGDRFVADLLEGAVVIRSLGNLARVLASTVLVWLATFIYFQVSFYAIGLSGTLPMGAVTATMVSLAIAAPSGPGFVGVYQAGCVAAFLLMGISKETALAYSIVTHLHQYLFMVSYGAFVLPRFGLSFTGLRSWSRRPGEDRPPST